MKFFFLLFLAFDALAIPTFEAKFETTSIPMGTESTDDAAIYFNPHHPEKSLILGVSKNKMRDGGMPGLGVYDLSGREVQYLNHGRLNNVDFRMFKGKALALASNRDKKAVSLFEVNDSAVGLIADLGLSHLLRSEEEPYGICAFVRSDELHVALPMKSGLLYLVRLSHGGSMRPVLENVLDMRRELSAQLQEHLIGITVDDVIYEEDLPADELALELKEELSERFILEGCTVDDATQTLYLGMEQLGIFKIDLEEGQGPVLVLKTEESKEKVRVKGLEVKFTNDIEGVDLYRSPSGGEYLFVSVQGIDQFAILNRKDYSHGGSFKLAFGDDPVTETDGLAISSHRFGELYPMGVMVVHDHENTEAGMVKNANYKIVDLKEIVEYFKL